VLSYRDDLKPIARTLRANMTLAEQKLWFHIRCKQIHGVQFFRQRAIGAYIVDFYAPTVKLVVEVDGSQHFDPVALEKDALRSNYLVSQGLFVMRFDNLEVLDSTTSALATVHKYILDKQTGAVLGHNANQK
jgi:very-short-patch-repair endonuclease